MSKKEESFSIQLDPLSPGDEKKPDSINSLIDTVAEIKRTLNKLIEIVKKQQITIDDLVKKANQ